MRNVESTIGSPIIVSNNYASLSDSSDLGWHDLYKLKASARCVAWSTIGAG